jgi:hypothetical protein
VSEPNLRKYSKTVEEIWEEDPKKAGSYVPFYVAQTIKNQRDILQKKIDVANKILGEVPTHNDEDPAPYIAAIIQLTGVLSIVVPISMQKEKQP